MKGTQRVMEGWKQVSIGTHADLINGFAFPSEEFTEGEGLPLIRIRDLERQKTEVNYRGKYDDHYLIKKDDLLIGMDGDFVTVKWKGGNALLNQRVCKLTTKNSDCLFQDFLYYRIVEEIHHINRITAATTVKHLSSRDILGIKIELPSKPEQAKIAEILSTVDQAIEQTEALIAKQQRIKTGLMQDLLTRGIDEHGNLRSEQTHKFKDSPLGRIPTEWEVAPFGSRVESSAFGPRFPSTAYSNSGNFALLRTTDLDDFGNISYSQMPRASLDTTIFQHHVLDPDDLLITRSGTIGIPAIFEGFDIPVIPGAFIIRFRLLLKLAVPAYWRSYFNWKIGRHRLMLQAEGGVQKNLRGSAVNNLVMAFPRLNEQQAVATLLIQPDYEQQKLFQRLAKLRSLKSALMLDLLTGKKRVTALLKDTEVTTS